MKVSTTAIAAMALLLAAAGVAPTQPELPRPELPRPLHLDDIHYVISDEAAAMRFIATQLGGCEMAHPDRAIRYIRFMSLRYGQPTLTVTGPTPADEPDAVRAKVSGAVELFAEPADAAPRWGVRWVALSTRDLDGALAQLARDGVTVAAPRLVLPHDPTARAAQILGPDNLRLTLVERAGDRGSRFGIDHLTMLVRDAGASERFFVELFGGTRLVARPGLAVVRVADATLVLAEPETLGIRRSAVAPIASVPFATDAAAAGPAMRVPGSVEHLGFLYADVPAMVAAAARRGYRAAYPPVRYQYLGRRTPYTVSEFLTPDGYGIEVVGIDGRVGPHAYYAGRCDGRE